MAKIKMLRDCLGSDKGKDGIQLPVRRYGAGMQYEVGDSLAEQFVDHMKAAEYLGKECKDLGSAPENKAAKKPAKKKKAKKADKAEK